MTESQELLSHEILCEIEEIVTTKSDPDAGLGECRIKDVCTVMRAVHPDANSFTRGLPVSFFPQDILTAHDPLARAHRQPLLEITVIGIVMAEKTVITHDSTV